MTREVILRDSTAAVYGVKTFTELTKVVCLVYTLAFPLRGRCQRELTDEVYDKSRYNFPSAYTVSPFPIKKGLV